ncbi:hypothetical protein [Pseudomaricurvus hydrocarbonicus]|nr:hypothetical protein [Aestuariicella hydrocarbonica]
MAQETCGNDINTDAASFSHRFEQGSLRAKKTLRLVPGADVSTIAVVEGEVLLPVTTTTKTLLVAADTDLTSIEKATIVQDGMQLRIKSIEGDRVSFVVSGDQQRLLAVRGLNADKRYLQAKGSSSMGDIHSGKKSVSANYQGEVAFVEVVVAVKQQPLEYRFRFNQSLPLQKSQSYAQQPQLPQPYHLDDWSNVLELAKSLEPEQKNSAWLGEPLVRQRTEVGLLSLFPSEVTRGFGGYALRGYVQLDMPYVQALDGYQGRAVFSANQLNLVNHDPVKVSYEQNLVMNFKGFGNNYKNSNKTEAELRQELYLQGNQQMSIPLGEAGESLKGAQLHSIEGELQLKLPKNIAAQMFDAVTLGHRLSSEGLTLKVIELAVGGIKLSAEGDTSKVMDILVLDKEGKQIGHGASFSEEMRSGMNSSGDQQPPRLVSDLRFNGELAALQVVMVTDTVTQRYPVTLSVHEQE